MAQFVNDISNKENNINMENNVHTEMYSGKYVYNNVEYVINDTYDVHQQLCNDSQYLKQYCDTHLNSLEISSVISTDTVINAEPTQDNFAWTVQATKLLLDLYRERKAAFRDPKIKKKKIWSDIREKFLQKGYTSLTEDCLDRKMRNMKKTFRTIKDNNKKSSTGRGRVSWEYFDIFQEIFEDDRTINIGTTLSSLNEKETEVQQECYTNEDTDSVPSVNTNSEHQQFFPDIPYPINLCSLSPSSTSSTSSIIYSPFSPILDDSALQEENNVNPSTSTNSPDSSNTRTSNIGSGSIRHKSLYTLRKEQLLLDGQRIQLLQELVENISTANKIQQRRNELLEGLLMQRNNSEIEGEQNNST